MLNMLHLAACNPFAQHVPRSPDECLKSPFKQDKLDMYAPLVLLLYSYYCALTAPTCNVARAHDRSGSRCHHCARAPCRYVGHEHRDRFFTPTQRHLVAYEVLANIVYGSKRRAQVGIERLVGEQIYTAAYPLHEVPSPPANKP